MNRETRTGPCRKLYLSCQLDGRRIRASSSAVGAWARIPEGFAAYKKKSAKPFLNPKRPESCANPSTAARKAPKIHCPVLEEALFSDGTGNTCLNNPHKPCSRAGFRAVPRGSVRSARASRGCGGNDTTREHEDALMFAPEIAAVELRSQFTDQAPHEVFAVAGENAPVFCLGAKENDGGADPLRQDNRFFPVLTAVTAQSIDCSAQALATH